MTYLRDAAARWPDKTAFADAEAVLTYGQLWDTARGAGTAVSRRLGGARREPVFVCIGRNVGSIAAFWAVAASGNFYVPIDPSLPDQRLRDIFETMTPRLVVTTQGHRPQPFLLNRSSDLICGWLSPPRRTPGPCPLQRRRLSPWRSWRERRRTALFWTASRRRFWTRIPSTAFLPPAPRVCPRAFW